MTNRNDPAFPNEGKYEGLTKRELFAALAMQGLLSNLQEIRKEGFKDSDIEDYAVIRADSLLRKLGEYHD